MSNKKTFFQRATDFGLLKKLICFDWYILLGGLVGALPAIAHRPVWFFLSVPVGFIVAIFLQMILAKRQRRIEEREKKVRGK